MNTKAFLAHAQKARMRNEARIKRATIKTRELLQDERTKATVKKIVEDERTKTFLVTGSMIGLAAAKAALTERTALAAATAAAAEHRRLSEASGTSRKTKDEHPFTTQPRESESDQVTPQRSADPSSSNTANPMSSEDGSSSDSTESTWTTPTWSDTPASKPEDSVIQAPVKMLMNESGMFLVEKHPHMPGLSIEATKTDRITFAIAIEWKHRMERVFYTAHEIPETWTAVRHDEFFVPMELRRDEAGHIWCRWLEPTKVDREMQRDNPYIPMDGDATYRNIKYALRVLGGGSHWRA